MNESEPKDNSDIHTELLLKQIHNDQPWGDTLIEDPFNRSITITVASDWSGYQNTEHSGWGMVNSTEVPKFIRYECDQGLRGGDQSTGGKGFIEN